MQSNKPKKKIIVVLGMHRSGTSLITRSLMCMNVTLGENLLPPQEDNPKGFWEDEEIVEFNDRLLASIGASWSSLGKLDFQKLDNSLISAGVDLLKRKIEQVEIFGIKDPRLCRLLPIWKEIFKKVNCDIYYVLMVRNPISVASSLEKRDGFHKLKSYLMWFDHVTASFIDTIGEKRVLVKYEHFLDSPSANLQKISTLINEEIGKTEFEDLVNNIIEKSLVHFSYDQNSVLMDNSCPLFIKQLNALISKYSENDTGEEHDQDAIKIQEIGTMSEHLYPLAEYIEKLENDYLKLEQELKQEQLDYITKQSNYLKGIRHELLVINERNRQECNQLNENITSLTNIVNNLQTFKNDVLSSNSWKLTSSLRRLGSIKNILTNQTGRSKETIDVQDSEDIQSTINKLVDNNVNCNTVALNFDKPNVLIIGDISIPALYRYRVKQKIEMFQAIDLGYAVFSWTDYEQYVGIIPCFDIVIFYRVPANDMTLEMMQIAKRTAARCFWEVDDLIFDHLALKQSKTLSCLDSDVYQGIIDSADGYKKAMMYCNNCIASTPSLAQEMKKNVDGEIITIENCIDQKLKEISDKVLKDGKKDSDGLSIVYGSGSNTHNTDFLEVSNALLRILDENVHVILKIMGPLKLPAEYDRFQARIKRFPLSSYEEYLLNLSDCSINIAPLEQSHFNESKSNIKFIEASLFKIPSVCSARLSFKDSITNGVTGFLCDTEEEWYLALKQLILDNEIKREVGNKAYEYVFNRYWVKNIAKKLQKDLDMIIRTGHPLN